jgi:glycosyltransferase involved in cell wall biosynthesis
LCEQTLEASRFEVCVINNGSTDTTPQVVDLIKTHYPKHRVFMIDEPTMGLSQARNAGLLATQGPLVASTDDDALVPPGWLAHFLALFAAQPDTGKVGGEVMPIWGAPRPAWLTDGMLPLMSAATGFGDKPRYMNEGLLECNSCYRRAALAAAGNFPTSLGRKGNNLLSAEHAVDLVMNVSGWKLYFDPTLIVNHFMHPDRVKPIWFRRRYFWQGVSDHAVRVYLQSKGLESTGGIAVDMPFDRSDWAFINNADEPPTEANLNRLRSLGFILARTGFIPVV